MKATKKISSVAVLILSLCFIMLSHPLKAQDYKARLSVDAYNIMGESTYLLINAKYKEDKKYLPATKLELTVYRELNEDSIAFLGKTTTNAEGNAEFNITLTGMPDSIVTFKYVVKIEDSDKFKNAKKAIKFMDAHLTAEAIVEDSVNTISATLTDALGNPIKGEKISVLVQRLFAPLTIGKSSYKTDGDGNIKVAVENPLPGTDGNLDFEIMMDSKKYGIVKYIFVAPIGKVIVDESTFDQRTLWSPPGKTPIFLASFAGFIILGIWLVIFILVRNLFKISKS